MYKLESFSQKLATVINDSKPYRSIYPAETIAEAENIVIGLNQPDLLAELAQVRYDVETAGLELEDGLLLRTDRESRGELFSTYANLANGLIPDTNWKAANGWRVVTLEEMKPLARALAAHVRGCFAGESTVATAIKAAATMEQIEAIGVRSLFTDAYQAAFAEVMAVEAAA